MRVSSCLQEYPIDELCLDISSLGARQSGACSNTELLTTSMDSSGHSAESDGNPHPKVIDFLGVSIAILTLILPVYTISLYSSPVSPGLLIGRTGLKDVSAGQAPLSPGFPKENTGKRF